MTRDLQDLYFHPASEKDYRDLPDDVRHDAGYNLHLVQTGKRPEASFGPLSHLGSGVMELKLDHETDTYRVIYVAKLSEGVFVLDAFKKKSPSGRSLPKNVEARIRRRYQEAKTWNEQIAP